MHKFITVTCPKEMTLTKRISEVSSRINEWLKSLEGAVNNVRDKLQLVRWELKDGEYYYHYSIVKRKVLSAAAANHLMTDESQENIEISSTDFEVDGAEKDVSGLPPLEAR